jgi:hypothetical protein
MKTTDMRAKARAIFGSAVAEPMPKQPNGAKALQQRANARPIPTYKVGGVVKKPMPTPAASAASGNRMSKQEGDEMRFMDMMEKKKKSSMPSPAASAASGNRMAREEGAEMRKMKMAEGGKMPDLTGDGKVTRADVLKGRGVKGFTKGGKAGKYADGGMAEEITVEGRRPQNIDVDLNRMQGTTGGRMGPPAPSSGGTGRGARIAVPLEAPPVARGRMPVARTAGYVGPTVDVGDGRATLGMGRRGSVGVGYAQPFKKGGDVQTSSDTARKLATEMGGMKKGGKAKPKDGLAVMIAIGKPMKPAKKMNGGAMASGSKDMEASKVTRAMADGGDPMGYMGGGSPMGYAAGGAGKTRKGQAPIKKAQGGAAKVRKGMMTPEGNIINVMNKMRGK